MVKRSSALQPGIGVVGSASPLPTRNKRNRNLNVKPSDEKASFEDGGDASLRLNVVTPPPKPGKRSRRGRVPEDIGIPKLVVVKKDDPSVGVPDGAVIQLKPPGLTLETLRSACEYLATVDERLAPLIQLHGLPERLIVKGPGAFATLSKSICFQQLATAAAAKIFARVLEACQCTELGILDYSSVLNSPQELLCAAGLSRNKASYLHDLARHFQEGLLSDDIITELDVQGLHTSLTKVRGLGPWSVDMFAMFHLGLPDVLPVGDLGVRRGMQALYGLKTLPSPSQMEAIANSWQPWRSVGSYFMWRVDTNSLLKPSKKSKKPTLG